MLLLYSTLAFYANVFAFSDDEDVDMQNPAVDTDIDERSDDDEYIE